MSFHQFKSLGRLFTQPTSLFTQPIGTVCLLVATLACGACGSGSGGVEECEANCDFASDCGDSGDVDACYSDCQESADEAKDFGCESENEALEKCWLDYSSCDSTSSTQEEECYDVESAWEQCMGG